MSIWVAGDTHGDSQRFNTNNYPHMKRMSRDDSIIIAGDFGGVWAGGTGGRTQAGLAGGQALYHPICGWKS